MTTATVEPTAATANEPRQPTAFVYHVVRLGSTAAADPELVEHACGLAGELGLAVNVVVDDLTASDECRPLTQRPGWHRLAWREGDVLIIVDTAGGVRYWREMLRKLIPQRRVIFVARQPWTGEIVVLDSSVPAHVNALRTALSVVLPFATGKPVAL